MNVAQWTRGVLETFADEWFTISQLHAEVESRSEQTIRFNTVEAAVWRAVDSGVVESRWDEDAAKIDGTIFGRPRQQHQVRKEYRWA